MTAAFALGLGLIVSVFTAKYRDLENITQFLLRLFMFMAPVVYPVSLIPEKYKLLFWLNPLTSVIETFRAAFFSRSFINWNYFLAGMLSTGIILMAGLVLFNKRAAQVMDII
jgi:lipopolysaccharide transport system permease protein